MSVPPKLLLDGMLRRGVSLFTGVPCSILTPLMNEVVARDRNLYLSASNEGEALATAAGTWLGGGLGAVLCQNSGLGNMVNPLTSLADPCEIPALLLVSRRGRPDDSDEPQHELMGRITTDLLDLLGIPWTFAPADAGGVERCLDTAFAAMTQIRRPYVIVIHPGDLGPDGPPCWPSVAHHRADEKLSPPPQPGRCPTYPTRTMALREFMVAVPSDGAVIATTGMCGRELFALGDRNQNLYCVGCMGYASALAHGLALTTARPVYVLDGDGAAIMHMGSFATIAERGAANFSHIILDNGTYDSTGGQPTASSSLDFVRIAQACGYSAAVSCQSLEHFRELIQSPSSAGPLLIHMRIRPGTPKQIGRPTIGPADVARRLRRFMTETIPVGLLAGTARLPVDV